MDAGDDDRRWYEEIERRLTERFRGVYICVVAAAVFGVGVLNTGGGTRLALSLPTALFALMAVVFGVIVMREHDARRALVRAGLRLPLQMPRIGRLSVAVPTGAAGVRGGELWRLEGRVFDATRGEYVECASDWQKPPPPELDPERVPPLLVDPQHPGRRWLPVGALRTSGYAPS